MSCLCEILCDVHLWGVASDVVTTCMCVGCTWMFCRQVVCVRVWVASGVSICSAS